jgi:L-ascorbate metabolism protein UlaG (beta-lactamase superfamily)
MGSVLELEHAGTVRLRLYVTGDTLCRPGLAEIPRRLGEIDVMLIHLGGTRILGLLVTMDDRQGAELTRLIRPGRTIPIHFDDYRVMKSPLDDYLRHNLPGVRPVSRGETFELPVRVDEEPK